MLPRRQIAELLDAAAEFRLFVLLEAFDAADLELSRELLAARRGDQTLLVGINCRDLQTLKVVQQRFAELAPLLPGEVAMRGGKRRGDGGRRLFDAAAGLPLGIDRHGLDEPRRPCRIARGNPERRTDQCDLKWLHFPACGSKFAA